MVAIRLVPHGLDTNFGAPVRLRAGNTESPNTIRYYRPAPHQPNTAAPRDLRETLGRGADNFPVALNLSGGSRDQ
jgi:hypothetical protein